MKLQIMSSLQELGQNPLETDLMVYFSSTCKHSRTCDIFNKNEFLLKMIKKKLRARA